MSSLFISCQLIDARVNYASVPSMFEAQTDVKKKELMYKRIHPGLAPFYRVSSLMGPHSETLIGGQCGRFI